MMKLYAQRLAAIIAVIAISGTAMAQKTVTFTGNFSTSWNTAGNWDTDTVPNGNYTGATIVIKAGLSAYITGTVALNGVKIIVKAGSALQIGNGSGNGANKGVLTLDNASAISIDNGGAVKSKDTTNTSNVITIGGVVKFQGGLIYTTNTGSGMGLVTGPARADATTLSGASGFAAGSLPVTLSGFGANLISGGKVTINWNTQQETNTDHFDIQRSSDGLSWQALATVKATGFSSVPKSYSSTDNAPQKGVNLYRLKTVDADGNFSFSSIVNVRLSLVGKISLFPNPAVHLVGISLAEVPAFDWTVRIINISGQAVLQNKFSKDQTTVNLPVSHLPAGNYTVEITDGVSRQSSALMVAHQ